MTDPVRILLPFSECKVPGGKTGLSLKTCKAALRDCLKPILPKRLEAVAAFRLAMNGGCAAQAVLGLAGPPFAEALAVNRGFDTSRLASVFERNGHSFTGAFGSLPLAAGLKRRLDREVYFICPLLGVLRPNDLVPDYRIPAGANLPRIGSLHKFWKAAITEALNRALKGAQVFSFLPARLDALWKPDGREAAVTLLKFSRMSGDRMLAETAAVPRLSAEVIRFVFESDARSPADLMRFRSSAGHVYSASRSVTRGGSRCLQFVANGMRSG